MLVPTRQSVFVLGCLERRVTLLHQQVRALNLVYALHQLGYCHGKEVAVVGAGVAGLTAAAAFSKIPGCRVALLEREDRILSVLDRGESSAERYLDPVLYEWPGIKPDSETFDRYSTPLTNWPSGAQREVLSHLNTEWQKIRNGVNEVLNARDVRLAQDGLRPSLSWYREDTPHTQPFDLVVLALGFGAERSMRPLELHPYWERDDLAYLAMQTGSYLVSGAGDGAWTELFRLTIPGFRQDDLKHKYLNLVPRDVRRDLVKNENRALQDQIVGCDPDQFLTEAYLKMDTPPRLLEALKKSCKQVPGRRIVLNAPPSFVSSGSFIANRFLGSLLIKEKFVELWPGRITAIGQRSGSPLLTVVLDTGDVDTFNRVVLRHGTEPALKKFDPELYAICEPVLKRVGQIDRTCLPSWGDRDFLEILKSQPRSLGTFDERFLPSLAISEYLHTLAQRSVDYSAEEMDSRWSDMLVTDLASEPTLLSELLNLEEPLFVIYDPWDADAVREWMNAVGANAHEDWSFVGLDKGFLPLILSAWRLKEYRGPTSEGWSLVARIVREVYGIEVRGQELKAWPRQCDKPLLIVLYGDLLGRDELGEIHSWLEREIGSQNGTKWIVVEVSREDSLVDRMPRSRVARFVPPGNQASMAGDQVLPTSKHLAKILAGHEGEPIPDARLLTEILEGLANEILWRDKLPPKAVVFEMMAGEYARTPEEIQTALERLIENRVISQQFLANPFQQHLAPDDPHLSISNAPLAWNLATNYLVGHLDQLKMRLGNLPMHPKKAQVVAAALHILQQRGDPLEGLLESLSALRPENTKRFRAELLAAKVALPGQRSDEVLEILFSTPAGGPLDWELAGRLAKLYEPVRERLKSFTEVPKEGRALFPRMLNAIRALYQAGLAKDAREAAVRLATLSTLPSGVRVNAAELAAKLEPSQSSGEFHEILQTLAQSTQGEGEIRFRAACVLNRIGGLVERECAKNVFWELFAAGPSEVRHNAYTRLIGMGAHQDDRERMESLLWGIAAPEGGHEVTERIWAAKRLEEVRVGKGLGSIWLAISDVASLKFADRIEAATWALRWPDTRDASISRLEGYVVDGALPASDQVQAARLLYETALNSDDERHQANPLLKRRILTKPVVDALQGIATEPTNPGDLRAAAAAIRALSESTDAAGELLRLGHVSEGALRIGCSNELVKLGKENYARRLLLEQIRDGVATPEIREQALWRLGHLRQWEDLIAACELGEIEGSALDALYMVFGELGVGQKSEPIVKRMVLEGPPWTPSRYELISRWAMNSRESENLRAELEDRGASPEQLAFFRLASSS
ncbi:MAG: FAD-dependent oxidoreductase [Thermoanaerobaculia bacterium]